MQMWLSYPLYILSLFVLGPSSDQSWTIYWALHLLRLILFLLVTRRFIAPFILAKLSNRIRVRSVSLRSIRGLYYKHGTFIFNVDRIGIAYHRPSKERPRRFAIQVEGLRLNVLHAQGEARRASLSTAGIHRRLSSLFVQPARPSVVVVQPNWRSAALLPLRLLANALDPFARPMLRMIFLTGFRILVRSLPALTQVLDFEMDSAVVSFDVLRGAYLRVMGVTVSTQVQFEGLETAINGNVADDAIRGFAFGNFSGWNTRMRASAGRLWDRGWGNTRGAASVTVTVGELMGSTQSLALDEMPSDLRTAAGFARKGTFLMIRNPLEFWAAVRFNPRRMQLEAQTLDLSMDLAGIEIMADVLQELVDLIEEVQKFDPRTNRLARSPTRSLSPPFSPLVGAWSEMSSRESLDISANPGDHKRSPINRIAPYIKNIRVDVQAVAATFSSPDTEYNYRLSLDRFEFQTRLSTPQSSHIHRQWLGCIESRDCGEGATFDVTGDLHTLALQRSDGPGVFDVWAPLVAVTRTSCRALVTDVVVGVKCRKRAFAGDPNSAFVACELIVDTVSVTERLDAINESLAQRPIRQQRKPSPKSTFGLPRFHLDLLVQNVDITLLRKSQDVLDNEIALHSRTDGFELHLTSYFAQHYLAGSHRVPIGVQSQPISSQLQFNGTAILHPVFSRLVIQGLSELRREAAQEPLIVIDKIEVFASGDTYAWLTDDVALIDTSSIMSEVNCICDAISVDLWNPLRVDALCKLITSIHTEGQDEVAQRSPFDSLFAGVNARLSVAEVIVIVTSPDLNPDCELDLSRGLALRTYISASYCYMHPRHSDRTRSQRLKTGSDRQKLGLQEDLVVQAIAKANAHVSPEDRTALVQFIIWQSSCRSAIATEVAADHENATSTFDMSHSPYGPVILSAPMIVGRISLQRRQQRALFNGQSCVDTCDVNVSVSGLGMSFNLLNVYSAFLAFATTSKLAPQRTASVSRPPSQIQLICSLSIDVLDIFVGMARGQQMFIRAENIQVEKRAKRLCLGSHAVRVFVPTIEPQELGGSMPGRWDEFGQLKTLAVLITESDTGEQKFDVSSDALSVRVASGYKISDLVVDITVAVKAVKHIWVTVVAGKFFPHPPPRPEAAKTVPNISIHIGMVVFEAEDLALDKKLNLAWQAGILAQAVRLERETAFEAKCAAILRDPNTDPLDTLGTRGRYNFTSKHTVSIDDARDRLNMVHSMSWIRRYNQTKTSRVRMEEAASRRTSASSSTQRPYPIQRRPLERYAPLLRIRLSGLDLELSMPTFEVGGLEEFLHDVGNGMPRDMQYTLLVPLHIKASLMQGSIQLRDYPLPLLFIPQNATEPIPAFEFITDLVIAEEVGTDLSMKWVECTVVPAHSGMRGVPPLKFAVPKTAMPVKTYARPAVRVMTTETTYFSWGVSYLPAMQEVLRFVDTLTTPPEDNANPLGFWDKLRLVMHWQARVKFDGPVTFIFKGSRDPHNIHGSGAGFGLSWQGGTEITVGCSYEARELVQVTSESMQLIIPNLQRFSSTDSKKTSGPGSTDMNPSAPVYSGIEKVCAKFTHGVRMGLGFVLERTCASRCHDCPDDPFDRPCRYFDFKPHYTVQTRAQRNESTRDSFEGFRSDFIHMSFSLTSPIAPLGKQPIGHNNIYLSPLTFQHFFQWWRLFDNTMSLRIRHGKLFPDNIKDSKKFGRFIATIKYRFVIERVFITHVYKYDTRDGWMRGETPFIGTKAFMQSFQADLHQSAHKMEVQHVEKDATVTQRKIFNAVEVVIAGVELRATAAVFAAPQKQLVGLKHASHESLRPWDEMEPHDRRSRWVDMDDFVELLWASTDRNPKVFLSHIASCPRFTFFKHASFKAPWDPRSETSEASDSFLVSKFGNEESHVCLHGKEPTAKQTQINLATQRLQQLLGERFQAENAKDSSDSPGSQMSTMTSESGYDSPTESMLTPEQSLNKKIELLQEYIEQLSVDSPTPDSQFYYMPADSVDASAWAEFNNVYQVHSPNIFMNNTNRNLLLTYYQASRRRRGFEYHMATRAVKFLHDLAAEDSAQIKSHDQKRPWTAIDGAHVAVDVLRNLVGGEKLQNEDSTPVIHEPFSPDDPLRGWSEGVAVSRSHYCVLFKPQFVLQSQKCEDAPLVVTAFDISLQNFRVLDLQNRYDPVTGHIMNRNHAGVNGLQVFSPTATAGYTLDGRKKISQSIPLEVLVDYRCDSSDFDRLVPQTEAAFYYDKFNRNRPRASTSTNVPSHIAHQMDLVVVDMPRFSVAAKCKNFEAISSIVTDLILFSDPAHKSRTERLETYIFSYDFTDLDGAADLVSKLQMRIRQLQVVEHSYALQTESLDAKERVDQLSVRAQIFVLAEELNFVFDAISMAQDQQNDLQDDQQSGLKLLVSSKEMISWHMLDDRAELLAKLEVLGVVFSWLNKQDGSTSSDLKLKDMRVLHSSPAALWPEILMMHDQPANHPMVKAKMFAHAEWTVLPPVGGISIYQNFQLDLHPIRLQIESEIGRKILEYVWPARRARNGTQQLLVADEAESSAGDLGGRRRRSARQGTLNDETPRERRLARPRSQTNLRVQTRPTLHRFKSSTALNEMGSDLKSDDDRAAQPRRGRAAEEDGAAAMRIRSSQQKTFFRVHIPRIHVLLSARSDDFFCNEAMLYTNEINITNRTTSFEDMVTQFMPANPNWKGWVRIALSQPVIPVLPVAKELFTKTKWGAKAAASQRNLLRSGSGPAQAPAPARQGSKHFWQRRRKDGDEIRSNSRSRSRSRGPATLLGTLSNTNLQSDITISVQEPSPNVDHNTFD